MGKIIAGINMTLDGNCDHTKGIADDEVHQHYAELIREADVILYGRITFELMEFWKSILANPTGNPALDEFAVAMDRVPKIVFSKTLRDVDWESAALASRSLREEVIALRQEGKRVLIGSRSLIVALMNEGLIDEFQIAIHPLIAGGGLSLFEHINAGINLKLLKTKTFGCGVVLHYYGLPFTGLSA